MSELTHHIPRVVVWGDGEGKSFRAFAEAIHNGIINTEITGLITSNPNSRILAHTKEVNDYYGFDIEPLVVEGRSGRTQTEETQQEVLAFLEKQRTRNLSLMGTLVIMGSLLVEELNGSVPELPVPHTLEESRKLLVKKSDGLFLPESFAPTRQNTHYFGLTNTHAAPTLLTANTHGLGSQERMVLLGASESAHTFHAVAKGIDSGPILSVNRFPVRPIELPTDPETITRTAETLRLRAQEIERAHLPYDLEKQLYIRQRYLEEVI